ncbi:MAG TPA: hypothetical protein VFZ83_12085, partial [Acidimicrobiia bacterium]|nr:hypothetical protein [Acidimicrobiia bacterium]
DALAAALRRRFGGRYPTDPFGLDPHLCDLLAPAFDAVVRVDVRGAEHLRDGGGVLVANRGLGIAEPAALGVAVRRSLGRRIRVVGAPSVPLLGDASRRLGAIAGTPDDLAAALRAGHLVAVPLAPTWLRTGAGEPPLELVQAMMGFPVHPVAVTPAGPFGTALAGWRVRFGHAIRLDGSYPVGDPLGAAELAETVRVAVAALLRGDADTPDDLRATPGLAVPGR